MGFIQRMMYGRYGLDQFGLFLTGVYLLLNILSMFFFDTLFSIVSALLMIWVVFRMISRNVPARRMENARFLEAAAPVIRWFHMRRNMSKDKAFRYFKCPNCNQQLRAPRGKGRIQVNCRNCGVTFQERT